MPIIVGNSTVNTAITSGNVTVNTPQGFAEYNATRNSVMPTLRLDFVNSNVLDPRITFTRASSATYFNSVGVLSTAASNVPRIDFDPSTFACNGLLIEQASTNLALQSTFQSGWSGGNATLTANQLLSPDGTVDAAKFVENTATSAYHYIGQTIAKAASALVYTFSVFLKASGNRQVTLRLSDGTNGAVVTCDPVAGTIATAGVYGTFTSASGTMQTIGNGWYRFSLTTTSSTATTILPALESVNAGANVYTGDGVSGFYCFGAQLEQNSYVTSYIPTTSSTATRAADYSTLAYSVNPNGFTIVSKIFFPITNVGLAGLGEGLFAVRDSTVTYGFRVYRAGSTLTLRMATLGSITTATNADQNMSSLGVSVIYGLVFTPTSLFTILNGGTISTTSVTGTIGAPTSIDIGNVGSGQQLGGYMQNLIYYPVALTATELQSLTS